MPRVNRFRLASTEAGTITGAAKPCWYPPDAEPFPAQCPSGMIAPLRQVHRTSGRQGQSSASSISSCLRRQKLPVEGLCLGEINAQRLARAVRKRRGNFLRTQAMQQLCT